MLEHANYLQKILTDFGKEEEATLIAISEDYKYHLIIYPSELVISEAALELLLDNNIKFEILNELDNAFQSDSILNAGSQGELVIRLLFLSA
ncbi:6000_t:CDS:2 [Funneliformis caledonium]|uniref:6000_t:CDS:1 n=1 Tax=Funneliformis caledonium TaxID=1117310 RepID=A0A9N9EHZ0_9GLOM|nr:6000_t:CDS:2 [Funneliformis caledonium]